MPNPVPDLWLRTEDVVTYVLHEAGPPGPPGGGEDTWVGPTAPVDPGQYPNWVDTSTDPATGLIGVASTAETIAGTVTNKGVTPLSLNTLVELFAYNVKVRYGAVGNGSTDDTTAVQDAIDEANSAGGGTVFFPKGTYIVSGLTLYSNVHLDGVGRGSVIKLKNSANTDVIVSDGFSGLTGGTTTGGISGFKLSNLTIDGNRANNSSGWCLRVYGSNYTVDNVHFHEGKSGGVWTQWGSGGTNMESHWSNFKIYNCEGNLLDHNGPHDSIFVNGSIFNDSTLAGATGKLVYVHGQSSGSQFTNVHVWGVCNYCIDVINSTFFTNCQAEGATLVNLRLQANYSQWTGGHIFGTTTGTEIGVQFGLTGTTSAKGNRLTNVMFSRFGSGSFPIKWDASAGSNVVEGEIGVSVTATALTTGTPFTTIGQEDRVDIRSASPTELAESWAVPKIQLTKTWLPANELTAVSGSPTLSTTQLVPVWHMDASSIEMVGTTYILPAWWVTATLTLVWANSAGGSGDVKWTFRYDFIDAGQTLGTYSSLFQNGVTAGAQDVAVFQTFGAFTNVADKPFLMRIERNATDVLDTLGNDAYIVGILFNRAT